MKFADKKLKLQDAIKTNKQKVLDALEEHPDLISQKKASVAYDLFKHKDEIRNMTNYKPLRDLVVSILEKSTQPKAKEYLNKIKYEFDTKYNRDPRPNGYNEQYWFNELWQFIYNIMLKAENLGSPDAKVHDDMNSVDEAQKWVDYDMKKYGHISEETNAALKKAGFHVVKDDHGDYEVIAGETHDASCKDEDELLRFCKLMGEAHDKIMEAQDLLSDLINDGKLPDDVSWDLDDVEASVSEFEFMGEDDPVKALKIKYDVEVSEDEDDWDEDEDEFEDDVDDLTLMRENVEEKINRLKFDFAYDVDMIRDLFVEAGIEFKDLNKLSADELTALSAVIDKEF